MLLYLQTLLYIPECMEVDKKVIEIYTNTRKFNINNSERLWIQEVDIGLESKHGSREIYSNCVLSSARQLKYCTEEVLVREGAGFIPIKNFLGRFGIRAFVFSSLLCCNNIWVAILQYWLSSYSLASWISSPTHTIVLWVWLISTTYTCNLVSSLYTGTHTEIRNSNQVLILIM